MDFSLVEAPGEDMAIFIPYGNCTLINMCYFNPLSFCPSVTQKKKINTVESVLILEC